MEKLSMQTSDGVQSNIDMIAQLFPECVTEGTDGTKKVIDFDKLRQLLSDDIVEGNEERYQFTWPDKRKAILAANAPIQATLRPCREESEDFNNTQNLYIEGDNLDVLKCLKETYLHKVKMIYIDPPYNTGNDFVYEDDFAQSSADYLANSGQYDEQGNRLFTNTESNGRFHTDWLNMIYPRLKVARDLLTDDGVIFISIDDREVENLRKICDEIFGETNRLDRGTIIWENKGSTKGFNKIVKNHEYIVAYSKNADNVFSCYGDNNINDLEEIEHYCYNKPSPANPTCSILFKKGCKIYGEKNITFTDSVGTEVKLEIVNGEMVFKDGFLTNDVILRGSFPYRNQIEHYFEHFDDEIKTYDYKGQEWAEIYFNSKGLPRYRKIRNTKIISSIIDSSCNIPNYGSEDIRELLGKKEIFQFPKPKELVYYLMDYFLPKESLIIDFFSGSATTAHAVMKLNAKDNGQRHFILVQLPEPTTEDSPAYKAGYKNICEIGKERIRRAGKKIKEESPLTTESLDVGFRVLKLDSTNMLDVYYSPAETNQESLFGMVDNVKDDRTSEDLLFQVMLELGAPLSSKIEVSNIEGKVVYNVADNYLVACFDKDVTDKVVTQMAKMHPEYAVLRDTSMATDSTATNFEQIFKTLSPDTVTKTL